MTSWTRGFILKVEKIDISRKVPIVSGTNAWTHVTLPVEFCFGSSCCYHDRRKTKSTPSFKTSLKFNNNHLVEDWIAEPIILVPRKTVLE